MTTTAYISSLAPAQSDADHQLRMASTHLREIEITQPSVLATRSRQRVPSVLTVYLTLSDTIKFHKYYYDQLYGYIKAQEQSLAEEQNKHGSFPVSLAKIGKLLTMRSPLVEPAGGWFIYAPDKVPRVEEMFTPLADVKQFAGEWTPEDGYTASVAVPSYSAQSNGGDGSNQPTPNYSATIELETPCDITFYHFKTPQTADFDKAVERIVKTWPDVEKRGIVSSLGAARIADVFFVVTDAEDTDRFDAEIEGALSQYFTPVIAELFPYPRKSRF